MFFFSNMNADGSERETQTWGVVSLQVDALHRGGCYASIVVAFS